MVPAGNAGTLLRKWLDDWKLEATGVARAPRNQARKTLATQGSARLAVVNVINACFDLSIWKVQYTFIVDLFLLRQEAD